jgi:outer membrane protein insertion porin family
MPSRVFLFSILLITGIFTTILLAEEPTASNANSQNSGTKIIKFVDVRNNKSISGATILSKLQTKKGEQFLQKTVDEDLKRLYLLGYFSDVSVSIEDIQDGIAVIFIVTEKAPLVSVVFAGNKAFNSKRLKGLVQSKLNEFADERKLKKDADAIKDFYEKKGYPWVKVDCKIDVDNQKNSAKALFQIEEGSRAIIRNINIIGNTAFSDKRIEKVIKTRTAGFFRSGIYKKDVLEDDMERIKHFYKQEGYLDIKPDYEIVFQEKNRKKWIELAVRLEEGSKYITGDIKIIGGSVFSESLLKENLKLKPGNTFTEEALHIDVGGLQEYYFDRGYIMARVRPDSILNVNTDRVDIIYNIVEGEVCYVNKINIKGNTKTKDVVIRRELRINPGERYDGTKLKRSKERL